MTEQTSSVIQLQITQMILEDVQFRHTADYLAKEPKMEFPRTPASVTVEVHHNAEEKKAFVRLRVVAEAPEAPYAYYVGYVVLFKYTGEPPENIDDRLAVTGANMTLPFAREVIASLTGRGRFGPTWISPMDFNKALKQGKKSEQVAP